MPKSALLAAVILLALGGPAWGQANLAPDPMPRVPPQPGQGLPAEDVLFLNSAMAMSQIEVQLGKVAAKATDPQVQQIGQQIAETHSALSDELASLAKERQVDISEPKLALPDQGGPGGAASAVTKRQHASGQPPEQALQRLSNLQGEALDRAFVQEQIGLHARLADLYQTQASHSSDTGLASFAIRSLVTIQRDRDALHGIGNRFGIAAERGGQPPQYGDIEAGAEAEAQAKER